MIENAKKKIYKILVAVDGSDKSLEAADYALFIASIMEPAELTVLNVLDIQPWYYGESAYGWGTEDVLMKVYAAERQERQKILDKIKEKANKTNIQLESKILMSPHTANIAAAIADYAEKENINLIVVGTRGKTGFTRMLLGSVAGGVVTYAHCPVLVVK